MKNLLMKGGMLGSCCSLQVIAEDESNRRKRSLMPGAFVLQSTARSPLAIAALWHAVEIG
jgi:hypothetical protein